MSRTLADSNYRIFLHERKRRLIGTIHRFNFIDPSIGLGSKVQFFYWKFERSHWTPTLGCEMNFVGSGDDEREVVINAYFGDEFFESSGPVFRTPVVDEYQFREVLADLHLSIISDFNASVDELFESTPSEFMEELEKS